VRDTTEESNIEQEEDIVGPATDGAAQPDSTKSESPRDLAEQYLEALQRERASFINYRRRVDQERQELAQYAAANLLKKLLPVMDDFDRALAAIPEEERKGNKWVEGIELIDRKLHSIIEGEGVEEIPALGQPFDPNVMEAVAFDDEGSGGEDTVSAVFANGYKLRDRVLRPAMVKVTRG
jgi:molecular chaperone GrpE